VYGRWYAHSIVNLLPVKQCHSRVQTVLENWSKAHLETILFTTLSHRKFLIVYTISQTFLFSLLFRCIMCSACVSIIHSSVV